MLSLVTFHYLEPAASWHPVLSIIHSFDHLTSDGSLCPPYYSITGCVPCDISGVSCVDFQLLHPRMARPATWTFPLRPVVSAVTSSCLDSQMQCHVGRSDFWKSSYMTKHRTTSSRVMDGTPHIFHNLMCSTTVPKYITWWQEERVWSSCQSRNTTRNWGWRWSHDCWLSRKHTIELKFCNRDIYFFNIVVKYTYSIQKSSSMQKHFYASMFDIIGTVVVLRRRRWP